MTVRTRTILLRANALWLLLGSLGGLTVDLSGVLLARGPIGIVLRGSPDAAIGFVEAHGLALICSVLLWRAAPLRSWHLTGAAVHALLGTANLVFWQLFVSGDVLLMGYVTTALHGVFAALQLSAAFTAPHDHGLDSLTDFAARSSGAVPNNAWRP